MREESRLVDGKRALEMDLIEFVRGAEFERTIRLNGGRIPVVTDIATDAPPSIAVVNNGRWITGCRQPRCPGTSYVWIRGPHQFLCIVCCNNGIGRRWRPVIVPENWEAIEDVLAERHIWTERGWEGEPIEVLLLENLDLGYSVPEYLQDRADAAQAERERLTQEAPDSAPDVSTSRHDPGPVPDYMLPGISMIPSVVPSEQTPPSPSEE